MTLKIRVHFLAIFLASCCFSYGLVAQSAIQDAIVLNMQNWQKLHNIQDYNKAIVQAEKALEIATNANDKKAMAQALNSIGLSLIKKTKRVKKSRKLAKEKFEKSLFYLASVKDQSLRISNLENLKWLAERENNIEQATVYNKQIIEIQALEKASAKNEALVENKAVLENKVNQLAVQKKVLSKKVKSLSQAQLESELLIALQKNQVDSLGFAITKDSLLLHQKELIVAEQASKLALQESHIDLQNSQIDLQKSQRNFFLTLAALVGLVAIGIFARYFESKKHNATLQSKNEIIEEERKKSEQLLLNILPVVVANELKINGTAKARKYENATVLFSDFINFSAIAEKLSPERLVYELDFYFKTFDTIISNYKLEKIKTIGDAYMCVAGLPEENPNNPLEMVKAALEIQSYLTALKMERIEAGEPYFEARIGIHTGPLIAGVVGSKKFAFDVWGDTVNVAARLESKSEAGKVNISSSTYDYIKSSFNCVSRGKVPVKNKGEIEMYFVEGLTS